MQFLENLSKLLFWLCPTTFSEAHKFLLTVEEKGAKTRKAEYFQKSFNHDWKLTLYVPICNLEWCLVTHSDLHAKDHHATMRLETACFLQRLTVIITTTIWFFENNDICSTDIGNEKDDSTNVLDLLFFTENQYC